LASFPFTRHTHALFKGYRDKIQLRSDGAVPPPEDGSLVKRTRAKRPKKSTNLPLHVATAIAAPTKIARKSQSRKHKSSSKSCKKKSKQPATTTSNKSPLQSREKKTKEPDLTARNKSSIKYRVKKTKQPALMMINKSPIQSC
jgi:hypothetical protein